MADTSTKLEENVASLLCYVLGWISGIAFLVLEPENKTVRFHAYQSILVFSTLTVIYVIIRWIPYIGFPISIVIWVIGFIAWISLIVMASQGQKYKVPIAGDYAEKWAG
jgi:uncharacterized membrane protein